MPWVLRSLRWWIGHVLVVVLCITFVNLGFWQLRRAEERRLENQVFSARFEADPLALTDLLSGAGEDLDSLAFRPTVARGRFQPEHEVLVRSQVHEGRAGFHVVTPLLLAEGRAVLVNRGWVPLELDQVPSPAAPPAGEAEVAGWLRVGQVARSAADPGVIVNTVDLDLLQERMPWELVGVYLVAGGGASDLPIPVPAPDLADEGPHLLYALQWFAFTAVGAVGYVLLIRRASQIRPAKDGRGQQ